ncbi:MAG TPA: hypothetical protein VK463_00840 [Desulfomonilaceae bacterium]|nr:hypothetical protein [Desulfomonilaceae bacterium]
MGDDELKTLILQKQTNGRITCEAACDLANEAGVPPREIGRLLDELHIKIQACQLGCFT